MKRFYLILTTIVVLFTACDKEDEVRLSTINVTLQMASDYSSIPLTGVFVKILNTADNYTDSIQTDMLGKVVFEDLPPGNYNVSASLTLTEEQAFAATGYNQSITLNAISNGVAPMPGEVRNVNIVLDGKPAGSLLIKQFYYPAGKVPALPLLFFKDQFVEIYNNSDEVIYADGLYIAAVAPNAPGFANDKVTTLTIGEYIYTEKVLQIPGDGNDYPIQPGKSMKIAMNAIDFTESGKYTGTVDNTDSDFEVNEVPWLQERGLTANTFFISPDNPDVEDVVITYMRPENGVYFYFNSNGSSVVITRQSPDFDNPVYDENFPNTPLFRIPAEEIIDGIDFLASESAISFKRLPSSIDASFGFIAGGSSRSGKTAVRKTAKTVDGRDILMDTNNTANDFEFIDIQ